MHKQLKIVFACTIVIFLIAVLMFYQYGVYLPTYDSGISSNLSSLENKNNLTDKYNSNYDYDDFVLDYKLLDDLEKIPSPYVLEVKLPNDTWPLGMMVGDNGTVWIGGTKSNQLLAYDPTSMNINSFSLKDNDSNVAKNSTDYPELIWSIVESDGRIWMSQTGKNPLWVFDKSSHTFETRHDVTSSAVQMQVDRDSGDIWFTDTDQNILGVIQKTDDNTYRIHEFDLGQDTSPFGLYLDDDKIWVTEPTNNKILGFDKIPRHGLISNITKNFELTSSNKTLFYYPSDLIVLDNKIWFTEHLTNFFLEYDLDTQELTRYPTSINPRHYGTLPFWNIKDLKDRGFWFVEHYGNRIAFFETKNKILTEYEIPSRDPAWDYISNAIGMAIDPNNPDKLWFSELYLDKIGMVDRSMPVPFEIIIPYDNLKVDKKNKNQIIVDFTINILPSDAPIKNNEIFLKKSSSITVSAGFGNMTVQIEPDHFKISGLDTFEGKLILDGIQNVTRGNYTVSVSVTDGTVTKTDYVLLNVN